MALVIVLSGFNGLTDLVQSLYNSFDADIEITAKQGKTFDPNTTSFQTILKSENLAYYSEVMEGNALLKYDDKQSIATIKGVSTDFQKMSRFDTLVREGDFNIIKNNIVIGKSISYVLQTRTNDFASLISIYAPKRGKITSMNPEDGLNEMKAYAAGVFSINDELDNYIIMDIEKARALLDYTTEVTSLEIAVEKAADVEKFRKEIAASLGDKYEVKSREQQNSLLYKTMQSEKLWTFIILIFILIIATFNVIGSLTMLIIEKKKDITILNNMGADIKLIRKIFLIEGLLITCIGAIFGLLIGMLICWIQIKFELITMSEGYVINAYPIKVKILDIFAIITAVLTIGFIASWYPVRIFTKKHLQVQ
ncbi:MAG: hypothetical protein A3K10_04985 [Bacteroidetes bacterium RIFCSPLOWO2_12_FULL_31_6]|nr:MAG: hypothetical protein A3K10_04985 [Bacteroidetes bacterium RIFCSPLOWO2_12_FULL_31_6]